MLMSRSQATGTAPASLLDATYASLRRELISGLLPPGQRLNATTMARDRGVSIGIVRETLARLISEGLVIAEAQKGFRAAPISADDLRDLTEARIEIECLCLARSIASGGMDWEADVVAAEHRLARTRFLAEDGATLDPDWARAHDRFHLALVSACDNRTLLDVRDALFVRAERYRVLSVPMASAPRDLIAEHRAIVEALLDRDGARVCELIAQHLRHTRDILLGRMQAFAE